MALDDLKNQLHRLLAALPIERFRNPAPVVGVLRFEGVIGRAAGPGRSGITLSGHEKAIEKLFSTRNLKAAALVVNSPGGSPVQSALIAKRVRDCGLTHHDLGPTRCVTQIQERDPAMVTP